MLCKGFPTEFATYLQYTKNLRFEDKPDYEHCRKMFRSVMARNNFENDFDWDWSKKKAIAATDSSGTKP